MSGSLAESRLERMIARLTTQRAMLDHVASQVRQVEGPILEIGLGKGRTFSHLRKLYPERKIWAFDFDVHAPEHSRPTDADIFLGDFRQSLVSCWDQIAVPPAFVHADIGTESRKADAALATFVGQTISVRLARGGLLLGDRDMSAPGLESVETLPVSLPDGITAWPYHLYRKTEG